MSNWKPVKDYEEYYQVSDDGHVRSLGGRPGSSALVLKELNHKGYRRVSLTVGKRKDMLVHRLVAEAFISNSEGLPYVNHIDGVKHHNNSLNLEWIDHAGNMRHAQLAGLFDNRGERHGQHKLTENNVRYIRAVRVRGRIKAEKLGLKFGVSHTAIYDIWAGRTWKVIQAKRKELS